MITGASQADAGILVVAASEGVMEQTKEHIWLCKTFGVQQLAVLVNKMDVANYTQAKFEDVKKSVSDQLRLAGYNPENIQFIPVSAYKGDNIATKSTNMAWYVGPTLIEQFDSFRQPEKAVNLPLRLPIQDVYNITGIGVVPVGRIETGIMKVGDKVLITPAREGKGIAGEVKSIEMHHEQLMQAEPGDNVGFNVRGVTKKDIARGDVLGPINAPPTVVSEFTAQLVVLNHPTVVTIGYTPVFHMHTAQVACQVTEIQKKIDPATGATLQEKPDVLRNGDVAIVKIRPTKPLVIEKQSDIPHMARFAVRDAGATVAAGVCIDYVKKI